MRRASLAAAVAVLVAFGASAFAGGNAEAVPGDWVAVKDGQKVAVSGTLRLVGSGLFNDYVITDADGHDWYVDAAERSAIKGYEQRPVSVEAVVSRTERTLADGKRLEDRRVLKKIKIIAQE